MSRRHVGWAVVLAGLVLAYVLLARRLAVLDPIAEMILGREGSIVPLAAIVLVLRFVLIVVAPALVAMLVARAVLDARAR
ncbi:MAG: hypothetical protein KIT84_19990 [Labilithrix sp.]|nr:hypothetical protein [Labilithrix sp.]MCW5813320.1 hypothetical protein [Labilithrix sp.]